MVNLWNDIQIALQKELLLVHLTAAPIKVSDVAMLGFGKVFDQKLENIPAFYDMRSQYAKIFSGTDKYYQYNIRESILAIRAYAQSEPIKSTSRISEKVS